VRGRDIPTRPLLVQDTVTALFATDRLALVDADLNAALRTEIVHRGGRGGLLVARLVGAGRGGVLAGHFGRGAWVRVGWSGGLGDGWVGEGEGGGGGRGGVGEGGA
jgi:hypothetical protein